jgi:hypothetical protein
MNRNKTIIAITTLLVLLLLPTAFSFNCKLTEDPKYCNELTDSNVSEAEKDSILSALLYPYSDYPNHDFVRSYNLGIEVSNAPFNTTIKSSKQIKNAWISFLTIMPSVIENDTLFVPEKFTTLSAFGYNIEVPENYQANYPTTKNGDCKTEYKLTKNESELIIYADNEKAGEGKIADIKIDEDSKITTKLNINSEIKVNHYGWHSWCCASNENGCTRTCHECDFKQTKTETDSLTLEDSKDVNIYQKLPKASVEVIDSYNGMTRGKLNAENYSFLSFSSENFTFTEQKNSYSVIFSHKPYYIATLKASYSSFNTQKNINLANDTFIIKSTPKCDLFAFNHFYNQSFPCNLSISELNSTKLGGKETKISLDLLIYLIIIGLVIYLFYKLISKQFNKFVLVLVLGILLVPFAFAADTQEETSCGITNLASCIPEKMYDFFINLVNLPIQPLLIFIKTLLTSDVHIEFFEHVWEVICYLLSFFYLFLFLYSGFVFLTCSDNPVKRSNAKDGLKNAVLMILLVQASFFIYGLLLSLASMLNNVILDLIDKNFFLLTFDNVFNIGLEALIFPVYLLSLFFAMLLLSLRYVIVSFGVIIFPIGIFCYYVPPLKSYGRFILRVLGNFIFVTFIDLLVILGCSMIIDDPVFESFKIVVMIICFVIINYSLFWCFKFAMSKADTSGLKDDIGQAAKFIALAGGA